MTSLGASNSDFTCYDEPERDNDDGAHLLPLSRSELGLASTNDLGFLSWDPGQDAEPPGEDDLETLIAQSEAIIEAVGEVGCGLEAPLEVMYRFLVDPEPPRGCDASWMDPRRMFAPAR